MLVSIINATLSNLPSSTGARWERPGGDKCTGLSVCSFCGHLGSSRYCAFTHGKCDRQGAGEKLNELFKIYGEQQKVGGRAE